MWAKGKSTKVRLILALFLGTTGVGLAGCGQKKITECNALIAVINSGVQALEKAPKAPNDPTGVLDLKAMAEAMDKVASEAARVPLTIPELKRLSADYQRMTKEIAKAERDLASSAEQRDSARRAEAEKALESAVKQEDPLVNSINQFCQGH